MASPDCGVFYYGGISGSAVCHHLRLVCHQRHLHISVSAISPSTPSETPAASPNKTISHPCYLHNRIISAISPLKPSETPAASPIKIISHQCHLPSRNHRRRLPSVPSPHQNLTSVSSPINAISPSISYQYHLPIRISHQCHLPSVPSPHQTHHRL